MSKTPYLFSYKESDDLFFNKTRITDENYSEWNSLKLKDICGGSRLGIQGFSIDHYNQQEFMHLLL